MPEADRPMRAPYSGTMNWCTSHADDTRATTRYRRRSSGVASRSRMRSDCPVPGPTSCPSGSRSCSTRSHHSAASGSSASVPNASRWPMPSIRKPAVVGPRKADTEKPIVIRLRLCRRSSGPPCSLISFWMPRWNGRKPRPTSTDATNSDGAASHDSGSTSPIAITTVPSVIGQRAPVRSIQRPPGIASSIGSRL